MNLEIPNGLIFKNTVKVEDTLHLYSYFIKIHCMLKGIYLPNGELTLLSYYACYGISAETDEMFKNDSKRNKQMVSNIRYKLKTLGLIRRHEGYNMWELPEFLKSVLSNSATFVLTFEI